MDRDTQASKESQEQRVARLFAAIRENQRATDMMDEAMAELLGVNRTDARCLDILEESGAMTAGDLAGRSGLTTGAVTAVIDRLERAGYVRRRADPGDRRKVLVEMTGLTHEISEIIFEQRSELGEYFAQAMAPEQIEMIRAFLAGGAEFNREAAALLRQQVPVGAATHQERLQRARSFRREQGALIKKMLAIFRSRMSDQQG